jgi:hypothetical protein
VSAVEARIAAALAEHQPVAFGLCWCGWSADPEDWEEWRGMHTAHQASVVAALPDIAVVMLPKREKGVWFVGDGHSHVEKLPTGAFWVRDGANTMVHIPKPRGLAAALLAVCAAGDGS